MIELSFAVSSKKTGEEVHRSYGKFENLDDFFSYVATRYGYTNRDYDFMLSGREVR